MAPFMPGRAPIPYMPPMPAIIPGNMTPVALELGVGIIMGLLKFMPMAAIGFAARFGLRKAFIICEAAWF